MNPACEVGVVGYGAYVPSFRLPCTEVSRVWEGSAGAAPIREKAVPGLDEDVITMSIEAARNALARGTVDPSLLGAVWVGSESHPYAVKPSSTIVAEAIGAVPLTLAADWQFACKAGTEAVQGAIGMVGSKCVRYAMAIGMDTAQGRPGDALEYTAGAGGAAFILGPAEESLAVLEGSLSYVTDTPDFWRRQHEHYPEHASRFTGDPAYFRHVLASAQGLMDSLGTRASDYDFAVFHQPNTKFPVRAGRQLGFNAEQMSTGLLADRVGNTYAGASLLGFTAILDRAHAGARILVVSFGSGAGSDAFSFRVTDRIARIPRHVPTTEEYIRRRVPLDYATYARHRNKIVLD